MRDDKEPARSSPTRAFVLAAGLGKRLRPLTNHLPKPLLKLGDRPIICRALRQLAGIGVREVIINTHHAAEHWPALFPEKEAEGIHLTFRHEPVLLDTGGGLKNVQDFLAAHGTFFIYNADIVSTLPLKEALAHHRKAGNLATMVLRSGGGPLQVTLNPERQVVDIRNLLGGKSGPRYLFTGIHVVEPEIFQRIPEVKPESIVSIYLRLIQQGLRIGGVVLDQGEWSDVGTMEEYERLKGALFQG